LQQPTRAADVSLSPSKQDLALTDMWLVIRKRRVLLVVLAVGLAILGVAAGFKRGDRFTATGQLEIQPGSAADLKESISSVLSSGVSSLDTVIESDILILQSDTLLLKVVNTLKLQNDSDFLSGQTAIKTSRFGGQVIPLLHGNLDDPRVRATILRICGRI